MERKSDAIVVKLSSLMISKHLVKSVGDISCVVDG